MRGRQLETHGYRWTHLLGLPAHVLWQALDDWCRSEKLQVTFEGVCVLKRVYCIFLLLLAERFG